MSGPYPVAVISVLTLIALASIVAVSSNQMNYSLSAQQAMQLENTKNQENLDMTVQNNILDVRNNALNPIKILEFRSIDKITNITNKISYSASPLVISNIGRQFIPADFTETTFSGKKIIAITEFGNIFTAVNIDDLSAVKTGTGNGTAMINGMGLNSRIVQMDYFGKIAYGQGIVGSEDSLKPYTTVPATSNYAAELLSSDSKTIISIPKFNAEYRYDRGNLQLVGTTTPNILSYSQSRTVAGNGISTQTPSGITLSGTGQILVQLNDLGTQTLRLDGTISSGGKLRLVEKLGTHDLMTIPYDNTYGFNVGTGTIYMYSSAYSGYCGASCGWGQVIYGTYYMSGNGLPIEVSSLNNFVARASDITMIPSGTQNINSHTITSVDHQQSWQYYTTKSPTSPDPPVPNNGATVYYYDKSPSPATDLLTFTTNFVGSTTLVTSGKQYYLIAEPNGGTITVTGISYSSNAPYLKITNLPANIPYEIVKDGFISASGMAPASGPLTLLLTDVDVSGSQGAAATGILHLYPNSLAYRGSFSTVVFDNINNQTVHIPTENNKVYVSHAYVQIPVTGSVAITNTNLSGGILGASLGALSLSFLNGNYSDGDLIKVPVIPGYLDINMNINGIPTTTVISNVLGGTGIKVANPATQTINEQDTDSALSFITSTTGTVAYAIATNTGNLNANFFATISGSASLTNTVTLTVIPPPPPPPIRKDPLTGWVDVYKNGIPIQSIQLYFNDMPTFSSSNIISGNSQIQTASYSYTQTTITGTSVTSVTPGDMVEYYLYAKVHADGIPLTPPSGYIVSTVTSQGTATATIHSGSINTSN